MGEENSTEGRDASSDQSNKSVKRWIMLALKIAFAVGAYWLIFRKILGRDGSEDLWARLSDISWGWIAAGIAMQLTAICFATLRWRTLLSGQGIRPSWGFLGGSIMIARFFGAFTPGGFTGFGGWRIYDVAKHTGKVARATATIGVETFLGQAAMGVVVVAGALLFGAEVIGTNGVMILVACFTGIIGTAFLLLARPQLFRVFARFLPEKVRVRVQTLVDAICAYEGKGKLLGKAFALGVGVHAFNNLIYVCSAQAFGVDLSLGVIFFGANLTILATLLPASINGLGLREMSAVALFSSAAVGLEESAAILLMAGGFILCEMTVSAVGGLIFLSRRDGYEPEIEVDELEHEQRAHEAIVEVSRDEQPKPLRGLTIGLGAGALAGMIIGLAEAGVVMASGNGAVGARVLAYGAIAYGIFCAGAGAGMGLFLALSGRWMKREAMPEPAAYARMTAFLVAAFAFALGAFRIRRDFFHEELVWKSPKGLGLLLACMAAAAILYAVVSLGLRWLVARNPGRIMLRAWGSPVVVGAAVGAIALTAFFVGDPAEALERRERAQAPDAAGNILFIVVDTLRSDHLPAYGNDAIETPALDAFADDAVRFNMAFANASWTRPSFASILSGRMPSSHGVMSKADALPDELTTMPEALQENGWQTRGLVTNFNVAPYFNFGQGFDRYEYLEPNFVLGADDAAAKLLLVQVLKRVVEKIDARLGRVEAGSAYQDAEVVNRRVVEWLDDVDENPWFFFVGYMDPHDPYYPHPYDGTGYSRAANQRPDPSEAEHLRGLYNGEIEYWDSQFGQLVEELKRRGVYDDLTIVITSDHGEEFCEHGGFWHGTTLYDEQIRIPLFVKLPGNRRGGTTVGHWTQSVDLMPTVLRLAGLEVPEGVQGGDVFEGTSTVYAEESHEGNVLESVRQLRGTDEWKIITANPGNPRGLEPVELYRVDNDPGEQQDVAPESEEDVRAMMETVVEQGRLAREGAVERQAIDISDDAADRLQAIGYMGDEE
ncbi:MAG: sulfatase-like hydrolase/transferase [Myxococcota bacterium]